MTVAIKNALSPVLIPILAAAATFATFSIPDTAMAQPVKTSQTVQFSDLDLATADGQRTLDRRIATAARKTCGLDKAQTGSRIRSHDANACYDQALRSARQQVAQAVESVRHGG